MKLKWYGWNGHVRTDEEQLFALKWCKRNGVVVSFKHTHVWMTLPGRRKPIIAYDLADCVKAAIEIYEMQE